MVWPWGGGVVGRRGGWGGGAVGRLGGWTVLQPTFSRFFEISRNWRKWRMPGVSCAYLPSLASSYGCVGIRGWYGAVACNAALDWAVLSYQALCGDELVILRCDLVARCKISIYLFGNRKVLLIKAVFLELGVPRRAISD